MKCRICDSNGFDFLFRKNECRVERCSVCNLVQITNLPGISENGEEVVDDFFKEFYKDSVSTFEPWFDDLQYNGKKQRYMYSNFYNKIRQIEKRVSGKGKLLDVGCAFGFFLDAARDSGWSVSGVEIAGYAAEYATNNLGLEVINKPLMDVQFEESSFDVITLWYVIEHLPNPRQALDHLGRFLKDDGLLVISTPNVDSLRAKIQRDKWRVWIPPEHVAYYSPFSMMNLLESCGLECVDYETALPYEMVFRKLFLYGFFNKLKVSDNVIYYVKKGNSSV